MTLALVIVLTVISGFFDSQGFVHAAKIWEGGSIAPRELIFSALGYAGGIAVFWATLRFAREVGIVSAEAQTLGWFVATIIGVAFASRQVFDWSAADQLLAVALVVGLAVLMYRTGG